MIPSVRNEPGELRERLLRTATRMFADEGYSATSVRQVAEACGCAKPSLYYYFGSKNGLFLAAIQVQLDAFEHLARQWAGIDEPVRESTHKIVDSILDFAEDHRDGMRLLQRIELEPDDAAPTVDMAGTRSLHLSLLSDLMRKAAATGQLRPDVNPLDCAVTLAAVIRFQCEIVSNARHRDRQQVHRTIDLLFDGFST